MSQYDHQTKNAQSLVNKGAALMIKESELNGKVLFENIQAMMADPKNKHKWQLMLKKAKCTGCS